VDPVHINRQANRVKKRFNGANKIIDREFVTSAKKSRILTNFPKLKKFVKNSLNARVGVAFQQQLKNLMRFTVSC